MFYLLDQYGILGNFITEKLIIIHNLTDRLVGFWKFILSLFKVELKGFYVLYGLSPKRFQARAGLSIALAGIQDFVEKI